MVGFQSFPYFVTNVEGAMQHLILVPETYDGDRLVKLLYQQVEANRLPTSLVLSEESAIYLKPELGETYEGPAPFTTMPQWGFLLPKNAFHRTLAFKKREQELHRWARATGPRAGYFVGRRPKGEPALNGEETWLGGTQLSGAPMGLNRCNTCGGWKGKCIDELYDRCLTPGGKGDEMKLIREPASIIEVHCVCGNWNRCAACGESLCQDGFRLRSFFCQDGEVWYIPGFTAFTHVREGHCRFTPRKRGKKKMKRRQRVA